MTKQEEKVVLHKSEGDNHWTINMKTVAMAVVSVLLCACGEQRSWIVKQKPETPQEREQVEADTH